MKQVRKWMRVTGIGLCAACIGLAGCGDDDASDPDGGGLALDDSILAADEDMPPPPCVNVAGQWQGVIRCVEDVGPPVYEVPDETPLYFTLEQSGCFVTGDAGDEGRITGDVDGTRLTLHLENMWGIATYAGTVETNDTPWSMGGSTGGCMWHFEHAP